MQIQMSREWAGPRDPFGNYSIYPSGHVGIVDADVGAYLVGVGYARPLSTLTVEEQSAVDLIAEIASELRKVNVEPTLEAVATAIVNFAAIQAEQQATGGTATVTTDAPVDPNAATVTVEPEPEPGTSIAAEPPRADEEPATTRRRKAAG